MTLSDADSPLRPEFDDFLFAAIGEDANDMRLSVLSALARLDVDPWQEAAALSALSRKTATKRFAALLARLPPPTTQVDPLGTAARLIPLLPKCRGLERLSHEPFLDFGSIADPQTVIYVIFAAFALAAIFNATYPSPPPGTGDARAAISSVPSPPPAPEDTDRH